MLVLFVFAEIKAGKKLLQHHDLGTKSGGFAYFLDRPIQIFLFMGRASGLYEADTDVAHAEGDVRSEVREIWGCKGNGW
jgi:hypothetical protein